MVFFANPPLRKRVVCRLLAPRIPPEPPAFSSSLLAKLSFASHLGRTRLLLKTLGVSEIYAASGVGTTFDQFSPNLHDEKQSKYIGQKNNNDDEAAVGK